MLRFFLFGGVRVLGPDGIEIHLGRKQQQLLAFLMLAANRTVTSDLLVDYLWGGVLPSNPMNSLQDVVKRLRIALGDVSHSVIVTKDRDYGLFIKPDRLDLALFRRLATAGLALKEPEPAVARILLARALEYAVGDLPDVPPGSSASDEIHSLYYLRHAAVETLELLGSGSAVDATTVDEQFSVHSLESQPVGLCLRLAELGELALADLVGIVRGYQGRIHRLSQGLLIASFAGGGAALRSAAEIADLLGREPGVLLGGAISHVRPGSSVRTMEPLLKLVTRASTGQVLVSRTVRDSAVTARIKNLLQPIDDDLWQIGEALPGTATDLATTSEVPMVGRDETIREIGELIGRHRLVTLRGPGGIGKTRIARRIGEIFLRRYRDGVSSVDFAEADRHGDPTSLVVRSIGLIPEPYRRPIDTLIDRLRETERLLILDNCEEFVEEVRFLAEAVMDGCPGVTLLATSRSALGAAREVVHDVGELDMADAATLLVTLAFPVPGVPRPDPFESKVLNLCSQLDDVPLAVECAAAMVRAMGLEEATAALTSLPDGAVLPLLDAAHGGRGRHQSIELALNTSHRFLQRDDARIFERLSSIRGSFNREDAAGVTSQSSSTNVGAALERLCEASLLKRLGADRWRMLEPVRQFAATRLLRRGEQIAQSARHARHFVELAAKAEVNLRGPDEALWFDRLTDAYPNLVKALSWAVESGDAEAALRLTSSLWWYWAARGMFIEGSQSVEIALAVEAPAARALRAKALVAASHLAWWAGNPYRTETSLTEAMELITPREPHNRELISLEAWARTGLPAAKMWGRGNYTVMQAHLEEGLRLFSSIGEQAGAGLNLTTHSGIAWHYGDDELHYSKACQSLAAFQSAGHQTMIAHAKRTIGLAKAALGDVSAGRPLILEGLRQSEDLGDVGGLPLGLCFLGLLEEWGGDRQQAVQAFQRSIIVNRNLGQVWPSLLAIGFASEEACLIGKPVDGITLHSAGQRLTHRTGIRLPPQDRQRVQAAIERARETVGVHEATKAWDEGSRMELPKATVLALDVFGDAEVNR